MHLLTLGIVVIFVSFLPVDYQFCAAYSLLGSQLRDLQTNDLSNFEAEATNWTPSSLRNANKVTICNGIYLLGGYSVLDHTTGQYFERIYNDLPTHSEIKFSVLFWILDNWAPTDSFQFEFDSQTFNAWSFSGHTSSSNLCGDSSADLPSVQINGNIIHSASSLTFRVISQLSLDTTVQSFGLRNVELNFLNTQIPLTYSSKICAVAPISLPLNIDTCTCTLGQYERLLHSGKCFPCYQDCASCSEVSTKCTSCNPGKFLSSNNCITCDKSCSTCDGPSSSNCLTCASGYQFKTKSKGTYCVPTKFGTNLPSHFLNAPVEPETTTFLVISQHLQYLRYLNITMPPRLELLTFSLGRPILSLRYGFQMPEEWQEEFVKYPLDTQLESQSLHSSFLVNFWQELSSLIIIVTAAYIFMVLEMICRKFKLDFAQKIFSIFKVITSWNFCLILGATATGNLIFCSSLEFSTFKSSENSLLNFSFAMCIISVCAAAAFLIGIIRKARVIDSIKATVSSSDNVQSSDALKKKNERFRVLFDGFNSDNLAGKQFFLIYTIRLSLPMLLAFSMRSFALYQVILQTLINAATIACLIFAKPLRNKINYIQLVLFESIVLIVNIHIFALTVLDVQNSQNVNARIVLGDVIIVGNFCINILILVLLAIKLLVAIKHIVPLSKQKSKQDIILESLQLLAIPVQQGGMGFEQVLEDKTSNDPSLNQISFKCFKSFISEIFSPFSQDKNTTVPSQRSEKKPEMSTHPISLEASASRVSISPFLNDPKSQNSMNRIFDTERLESARDSVPLTSRPMLSPIEEAENLETAGNFMEHQRLPPTTENISQESRGKIAQIELNKKLENLYSQFFSSNEAGKLNNVRPEVSKAKKGRIDQSKVRTSTNVKKQPASPRGEILMNSRSRNQFKDGQQDTQENLATLATLATEIMEASNMKKKKDNGPSRSRKQDL